MAAGTTRTRRLTLAPAPWAAVSPSRQPWRGRTPVCGERLESHGAGHCRLEGCRHRLLWRMRWPMRQYCRSAVRRTRLRLLRSRWQVTLGIWSRRRQVSRRHRRRRDAGKFQILNSPVNQAVTTCSKELFWDGSTRCAAQFRFPVGLGAFLSRASGRPRVASSSSRSPAGDHATPSSSSCGARRNHIEMPKLRSMGPTF